MDIAYNNFESGKTNGTPWIKGSVPVGRGKEVYVDSRTGEGVGEICNLMKKYVTYQSAKTNFPSMTPEDIAQDIYILALEAIPKYDITRKANMLTFLQGHIRNRIINKCKYFSEKKRRATHSNAISYKVRCPSCNKLSIIKSEAKLSCEHCGSDSKKKWKRYNVPVLPIPFSYIEHKLPDEVNTLSEIISEGQSLSCFLGKKDRFIEDRVQLKLDFMRIFEHLDNTNKTIITMLLEGYPYKEIAKEVGISEKATYARVAKIIGQYKLHE